MNMKILEEACSACDVSVVIKRKIVNYDSAKNFDLIWKFLLDFLYYLQWFEAKNFRHCLVLNRLLSY